MQHSRPRRRPARRYHPSAPYGESESKVDPPPAEFTCLSRVITIWGWFFDIATILISLTDVISDILVAIQFWKDGETTWFWLVMSSLILSSIVYTVFGAEVMLHSDKDHGIDCVDTIAEWPRLLKYLLILPFAQLTPTLYWIKEQIHPTNVFTRNLTSSWATGGVQVGIVPQALKEEADAIAGQAHVMGRLDGALREHLNTHLLFYIETIVESIPQSIIQLLAVTFLGQATSLQVFSMSLSLISIVSKGYVISNSFTVKVVCLKFLLAAHDVFSLFYVFSTILAKDEPREVHLGNDIWMSYLSFAWLIKACVTSGIAAIVCCIVYFNEVGGDLRRCRGIEFCRIMLIFCLGVLLVIPVALAIEGAKLVWFVAALAKMEPSRSAFPAYAKCLSFLERGDATERFRYLAMKYTFQSMQFGSLENTDWTEHQRVLIGPRIPRKEVLRQTADMPRWSVDRKVRLVMSDPFVPSDAWFATSGFQYLNPYDSAGERMTKICGPPAVVLYTLFQLYSLIFPFVSFGTNYETQNLLQRFCFYALAGTLFLALFFIPSGISYLTFCMNIRGWMYIETYIDSWIASTTSRLTPSSFTAPSLPTSYHTTLWRP